MCELSNQDRIDFTKAQVAKVFPDSNGHVTRGASLCWDEEQWSRGAWAIYRPGEMSSIFPHVAAPEGNILFAGDHTSGLPGWMQGALESGIRAAHQINDEQ